MYVKCVGANVNSHQVEEIGIVDSEDKRIYEVNEAKRSEASLIEPTPRRSRGEGRR